MGHCDAYLEALDQLSVRPADLRREPAEHAEAAAGRHLDDLKSVGHNHALLLVVGRRDALEALTFARVQKQEAGRGTKRGGGVTRTPTRNREGSHTARTATYFILETLNSYNWRMLFARPLEDAHQKRPRATAIEFVFNYGLPCIVQLLTQRNVPCGSCYS